MGNMREIDRASDTEYGAHGDLTLTDVEVSPARRAGCFHRVLRGLDIILHAFIAVNMSYVIRSR